MNDHPEKNELLDDVLASPPEFRAALLDATLRQARRRRRWRQARNAGGVLAIIIFAGIFARQFWPENISDKTVAVTPAEISAPKSFQLVETLPLPSGVVVTTGNFSAAKIISSAADVTQIATTGGNFNFISDEQLLALVSGHPAVLIRTGPDSEELVFADPADRRRFFGQ
jgi:hypothetical protein